MKISKFEIEFQDGSICVTSGLDAKEAQENVLSEFPNVPESAIKEIRETRINFELTGVCPELR